MARRSKRDPEPAKFVQQVNDVSVEAPPAEAEPAPPSGVVILTCEQEGGAVFPIETTLAALTGEGVALPNYVRRVSVRLA
jgi:hypothetical protein